jgi:hypothetical protein
MKLGPTVCATAVLTITAIFTGAFAEDSKRIKDFNADLARTKLEAELMLLPSKIEYRQISNQDAASVMADAMNAGLVTSEQSVAATEYVQNLVACVDSQLNNEMNHDDYRFMETKSAFRAAAQTVFMRCTPRDLDITSQVKAAIVKTAYLATADEM